MYFSNYYEKQYVYTVIVLKTKDRIHEGKLDFRPFFKTRPKLNLDYATHF